MPSRGGVSVAKTLSLPLPPEGLFRYAYDTQFLQAAAGQSPGRLRRQPPLRKGAFYAFVLSAADSPGVAERLLHGPFIIVPFEPWTLP